ncbi:hypothetical protein TELCIR_04582, partial [Teladorsagia circumcincta]
MYPESSTGLSAAEAVGIMGSFLRKKRITEKFLHHSEFNRSLGLPLTVALAVHMAELSAALPKNCVLYQFTFASLGELPAFLAGWTAVLDANLLFRRYLHQFMSLPLMHRDSGMWIISDEYDFTALMAALISVFILCCNLRVVGTISLCLVVVAVLMTASCTMVGFFHADPQNWIDANFFRFGFDGVLRAVCALSVAFTGVDAASYLFDETRSPRRKMPVLLPTLVTLLSLFFFIVVMIFSLSTDVSKLSARTLVPEMFSVLNVPAA